MTLSCKCKNGPHRIIFTYCTNARACRKGNVRESSEALFFNAVCLNASEACFVIISTDLHGLLTYSCSRAPSLKMTISLKYLLYIFFVRTTLYCQQGCDVAEFSFGCLLNARSRLLLGSWLSISYNGLMQIGFSVFERSPVICANKDETSTFPAKRTYMPPPEQLKKLSRAVEII
jgi:hypothetical protein